LNGISFLGYIASKAYLCIRPSLKYSPGPSSPDSYLPIYVTFLGLSLTNAIAYYFKKVIKIIIKVD
jgi:hypothetical protein